MRLSKRMMGFLASASLLMTPLANVQAQETVTIGGNLELTGAAAAYGAPAGQALELAIEQVNKDGGILGGKELKAEIIDNRSDLTESASVATRLSDSDAVAILGPTATGVSKAAIPVTNEAGVPNMFAASTGDGLTLDDSGNVMDWIFRVCFEDSYQGLAAGKYAASELGKKKAYIITDQALDYSLSLADSFTETFTANGGEIVGSASYQSGDTDFQALLSNLVGQDIDLIYIPGYYTETGLIIKQARELGVDTPIMGGDGYASETLIELAGAENANDIYYTTHFSLQDEDPQVQDFIKNFEAKFGNRPDTFSALGYDAAMLLIDAIERAGSTDREAIRQAIADTKDFDGITGTFSMDDQHNPTKPTLMIHLQNGEVADLANASAE
ncbi:ABC transporter substrate-binding protein [Hutsoniella sourekii]|uniref:ABC transporter substrate-binding protein n=1 Tax=Hutsoniella sourekii TaxID=87650 RepID=UPI0004B9E3ED|nr:ABC transporter substrate-binding protein [Hutsoniella sourekii]